MVYSKYIKRGGNRFGPYYYANFRDENGKVTNLFLGIDHDNALKKEAELCANESIVKIPEPYKTVIESHDPGESPVKVSTEDEEHLLDLGRAVQDDREEGSEAGWIPAPSLEELKEKVMHIPPVKEEFLIVPYIIVLVFIGAAIALFMSNPSMTGLAVYQQEDIVDEVIAMKLDMFVPEDSAIYMATGDVMIKRDVSEFTETLLESRTIGDRTVNGYGIGSLSINLSIFNIKLYDTGGQKLTLTLMSGNNTLAAEKRLLVIRP